LAIITKGAFFSTDAADFGAESGTRNGKRREKGAIFGKFAFLGEKIVDFWRRVG